MSITPKQLSEWRALTDAAMPDMHLDDSDGSAIRGKFEGEEELVANIGGTVWVGDGDKNRRYREQRRANAAFFVAARSAMPALMDEVERLTAKLKRASRRSRAKPGT